MIDYQFQHNAHCVDYWMFHFMRNNPVLRLAPRSDEQIEYERGWYDMQNRLYHEWGSL